LNEEFQNKAYALEIIKECNHAWKELITGEKERKITHMEEGLKKLVRKLSKSNLLSLTVDDDEDLSKSNLLPLTVDDDEDPLAF